MRNGHCSTPVVLKRATTTRDDFGHVVRTWASEIDPLWVAIKTRVSASDQAGGRSTVDGVTFTTPWYPAWDILPTDRVTWNTLDYEILTVMERDGRSQFLDITASRIDL